jgi:16S rRNA (guanine966-N2)-methyltransferase
MKKRKRPLTPAALRIVGGKLRGRKLRYSGDPRVRPMKDRTREAVFNLVGPLPQGTHALDLFAGTGALGIEAISRGASGATLIEIHEPTRRLIRQNVADLGIADQARIIGADVFRWSLQQANLPVTPWLVFCCPPYRLFTERRDDLTAMLHRLLQWAPPESTLVVESDQSFDTGQLPQADHWRIRDYAPARIALMHVN